MTIAILGRQPKLGLAELESLYGAENVQPVGNNGAFVNATIEAERLGGTLKLTKPLIELPYTDWQKIVAYITQKLPEHISRLPEGKLKLGLSTYDIDVTPQQLFRASLELKKVARIHKRSMRIVSGEGVALNSATVLHNNLTGEHGMELNLIKNGAKTWLTQTTWVQNIDDYSRRDFGRPKRDAFVGMLPPKLAQIMLNLANVTPNERVLDPFCGTGVVLQEAALLGCQRVYGTDLQPRMIDYVKQNIDWLNDIYNKKVSVELEVADATTATWQPPIDHVVTETYLGQPLSGLPKPEKLRSIVSDCDTIITKFLQNLRNQIPTNTRLCIAIPAWQTKERLIHLSLLDRLEELGYNRVRFKYAQREDFIYRREDQIVARELLVITVSP